MELKGCLKVEHWPPLSATKLLGSMIQGAGYLTSGEAIWHEQDIADGRQAGGQAGGRLGGQHIGNYVQEQSLQKNPRKLYLAYY